MKCLKVGLRLYLENKIYILDIEVEDSSGLEVAKQIGVTIPIGTFFGLLTALWLIFNEIISIMENLAKMETKLPPFLSKFVIIPAICGNLIPVSLFSKAPAKPPPL